MTPTELAYAPQPAARPPAGSICRRRPRAVSGKLAGHSLRLGTIGFGGPIALAGYMQRDLVERRGCGACCGSTGSGVRIVAGRFEREHARVPEQGKDSIHPEDRARRFT